jgi:hypothetical protein
MNTSMGPMGDDQKITCDLDFTEAETAWLGGKGEARLRVELDLTMIRKMYTRALRNKGKKSVEAFGALVVSVRK